MRRLLLSLLVLGSLCANEALAQNPDPIDSSDGISASGELNPLVNKSYYKAYGKAKSRAPTENDIVVKSDGSSVSGGGGGMDVGNVNVGDNFRGNIINTFENKKGSIINISK